MTTRDLKKIPWREINPRRLRYDEGEAAGYIRECFKSLEESVFKIQDVTIPGITSGTTDMTPYFKLGGRLGGQSGYGGTASTDQIVLRGNTVATVHDWIKIPIYTASSSASPDTNRILRIETSDAVNIFNVQGDGATTITAPYTTYVSGNPILLTLQMDDATTSPSTIFRVRTQSANVFTISYTGGTLIDMATDNVGLEVQGGGATANIAQFRTSTPTTVVSVGPSGLTSISPSAAVNCLNLRAFNTTSRWIDFLNSGGSSIGGIRVVSGAPRILLNTTNTNGILNIVPPSGLAPTNQIILRAVWTDTASQGIDTAVGAIYIAPTLSNSVDGINGVVGIRLDTVVNDLIGDMNGLELNIQGEEFDALTGGGTLTLRAIHFEARSIGSGSFAALRGFQGGANHQATGTVLDACGGSYYLIDGASAGAITNADVLLCLGGSSTIGGTVTNLSSFRIENPTITGTVTNHYGIKMDARSGGTNVWSLHVSGSAVSVHAPNLTVGSTSSPTAKLHLAAGTTSANTGPLKFTSGSLMTSAEAGSHEYDGSYHYLTNSTARGAVATTANVVVDMGGEVVTDMGGEVLLAA